MLHLDVLNDQVIGVETLVLGVALGVLRGINNDCNQEFTKSILCFNEDMSYAISTLSMCSKNSADLTGHLQTHKLRKRSSHCDIVIIMMFYKSNSNQFHCGILGIVVHEWCMV